MRQIPITIDDYFFPEIRVRALTEFDASGTTQGTVINTEVAHVEMLENGSLYVQVRISVDLEKSVNPPYDFEIVGYGTFKPINEDAAKHFACVQSGAAILIGAARELIMTLTSKSPWAKFVIPPINVDVPPTEQPVPEKIEP